jgi:hypothetical protein
MCILFQATCADWQSLFAFFLYSHGFEDRIGDSCVTDEDCAHTSGSRVTGGMCKDNKCVCNLCKAGGDCKVARQSKPGKGSGARLVLDVAMEQDAAVSSAQNSRWASGATVFLHSRLDDMGAGTRVLAPPGMATDVSIGQGVAREANFPYTNCSASTITDGGLCRSNCLRRVQAIECCGIPETSLPITLGRFPLLTVADPAGETMNYQNPVLGCNILDSTMAKCFAEKVKQDAEGEICLNGASLLTEGYTKIIFSQSKTGWYETDSDSNNNGIPDQEEKSAAMAKQCVWPENIRVLDDGMQEPKYGQACEEDADCESETGKEDRRGKCVKAYRAFCPEPCDYLRYNVRSQGAYPLSNSAVSIMASQELAWVTYLNGVTPDPTRRFRARCARDATTNEFIDTSSCFTEDEARNFVTANYAMVNLYYEDFEQTVVTRDAAIDTVTLMGTIGGNLGLCVGFSIMTMVEWMELGVFAILSMPFFYFGIKMPYIKRNANKEFNPVDVLDEDVAVVLKNIKRIYTEKTGTVTAEIGLKDSVQE